MNKRTEKDGKGRKGRNVEQVNGFLTVPKLYTNSFSIVRYSKKTERTEKDEKDEM